jgi:hypothetical protein
MIPASISPPKNPNHGRIPVFSSWLNIIKTMSKNQPSPISATAQVTAPLLSPEEEAAVPEALTAGALRILGPTLIVGVDQHRCGKWIGLREHLQETMDFPMIYVFFPALKPIH